MENFATSGEKFPARLSKLHSTCPEEHFEETDFFGKLLLLFLFLD